MMIRPAVTIKPFKLCAAGELIRAPYRASRLALVATSQDNSARYSLRLQQSDGRLWPTYHLRETEDLLEQEVISYGSDYILDVDHMEQFEFGAREYSKPGLLYLDKASWFLQVAPASDKHEADYGFYEFKTGRLGPGPSPAESARFGKWRLCLPMDDSARPLSLLNFTNDLK